MSESISETTDDTVYCHYHPDIATGLRCNKCNKPICPKEAVRTPVGYRCPDCVRQQQDVFFTAKALDYVIAAVISLPVGYISQLVGGRLGFFVILVGTLAGGLVGELIWRATGKRRGRYMWMVTLAGLAIGAGIILLPTLIFLLSGRVGILNVLWDIVFFALMAGAAVARLRFGR